MLASMACRGQGRLREALELGRRALSLLQGASPVLVLEARIAIAQATSSLGDHAGSVALLEDLLGYGEPPQGACRVRFLLGGQLQILGRCDEARALFVDSLELARRHGLVRHQAHALHSLARLAVDQGRLDEQCRGWAEEALRLREGLGSPHHRAGTLNLLGEIARSEGDLDRAEARYLAAHRILSDLDLPHARVAEFNLVMVDVARGRFAEARESIEALEPWFVANRPELVPTLLSALLVCHAEDPQGAGWRRCMDGLRSAQARSVGQEADVAYHAIRAAQLVAGSGAAGAGPRRPRDRPDPVGVPRHARPGGRGDRSDPRPAGVSLRTPCWTSVRWT